MPEIISCTYTKVGFPSIDISVVGLKLDVVYFVSGELFKLLHTKGAVYRHPDTRIMQNNELSGHDSYLYQPSSGRHCDMLQIFRLSSYPHVLLLPLRVALSPDLSEQRPVESDQREAVHSATMSDVNSPDITVGISRYETALEGLHRVLSAVHIPHVDISRTWRKLLNLITSCTQNSLYRRQAKQVHNTYLVN